ncbi:hypothetical protein [Kribbella sindirgiensis]|uniref:Uncharacterized protein n=1 Tax=Kribbella sindirgiensis TaxID=1124744 RepID=A0A4R0JFB5_9ACTN|nr:hypothetical protein [Kribbella sindirgiensis]TCC43208.1 hypothetical protein E0H50_01610 [Kribbella sindirgiensis]
MPGKPITWAAERTYADDGSVKRTGSPAGVQVQDGTEPTSYRCSVPLTPGSRGSMIGSLYRFISSC